VRERYASSALCHGHSKVFDQAIGNASPRRQLRPLSKLAVCHHLPESGLDEMNAPAAPSVDCETSKARLRGGLSAGVMTGFAAISGAAAAFCQPSRPEMERRRLPSAKGERHATGWRHRRHQREVRDCGTW
jgi:hypothetical protein